MSMIITKLIGGLGNQMFQYAVGRTLSENFNVPLLLDASGFETYDLRCYELGEFAIHAGLASREERMRAGVGRPSSMLVQTMQRLGFRRPANVLREESFTYDERIESASAPVYLDGYWQSERYFFCIADILRAEFVLKREMNAANAELAAQIMQVGRRATSLHIRRGDYVSNVHTAQYHGACSLDYYRAAVQYIAERIGEPHFFVFSDDHDWVRQNFDINYPSTLVQINGPDRGIWDMMLMKACRHHIIANSSFSWWGAWLNPSSDKIVIAPEKWFAQAGNDTRDLIPPSWVRL